MYNDYSVEYCKICDKMCFMRCAAHDDTCITLIIGYDSTIIDM